jgi:two-component system chemotaxis response regulator CheB
MGAGYATELLKTPPVNRHRPSVDVLFDSAAEVVGRHATGVILTGMGKDGAAGLLRMRRAGARTFGQDEASCVVYGMPREAALIGAVEEVGDLETLARRALAVSH